ncbi:MAG: type II toxin-antitoxin system Phd/YefM family antitoxin [Vicinamibacterales bacterium]
MANRTVSIREAKTRLSRLVDEVRNGEEIVITKAGRPAARLVPLVTLAQERRLGALEGQFTVPSDLDAALPDDVREEFEGRRGR